MKANDKGFTLLEVMVAGLILFSAISTVSFIYKNVMSSLTKSEKHFTTSALIPFLMEEIRDEIATKGAKESFLAGEGENLGVKFYWEANVSVSDEPIKKEYEDSDSPSKRLFKIWSVAVTARVDGFERAFSFKELSWEIK